MTLTFELDPEVDAALHEELLTLWTEVTDADGAVGFVPPVTPDVIRPVMVESLDGVTAGRARLLVGKDESGALAATAFLAYNQHRLMTHWMWVYTVMIHPRLQGTGGGRKLMAEVESAARSFDGIRALRLGCRGGTGVDTFYARCGYKEVGRAPGAIKVAEDDYRDDITMLLTL